MPDHGPLATIDHSGEDCEAREKVVVRVSGNAIGRVEYVLRRAFFPVYLRSIDGFLNFWTVKKDLGTMRKVVEGARKAENVPEQWAGSSDLVNIEALGH